MVRGTCTCIELESTCNCVGVQFSHYNMLQLTEEMTGETAVNSSVDTVIRSIQLHRNNFYIEGAFVSMWALPSCNILLGAV